MAFSAKKIFINPYTISIVLVILITFGLLWGALSYLDTYTNHGQEIEVPDLSDMTVEEATTLLGQSHLKCAVVDSVFMKGKKLGVIVEQTPAAHSKVKENRTIYLITNSSSIRKVILPDVKENSLRQAEAMINSVGLKVDSVEYKPSQFKDLVLGIKYSGKSIEPGSRIPEGSGVILLVGCGNNSEETTVPSFRALNLTQAMSKAHSVFMNIGEIHYDVEPKDEKDKDKYFVYKQKPITGTVVEFGSTVNLYFSKDPTSLEDFEEIYHEEDSDKAGNGQEESLENL